MNNKKLMPPLWIAYPSVSRYSIGWRMGSGEYYRYKFYDWFDTLTNAEQQEYIKLFPAPKRWYKFWEEFTDENFDDNIIHDTYFINNKFLTIYWQKNGKPEFDLDRLKKQYNNNKNIKYEFFWGHRPSPDKTITKSCFSQWYKADFWLDTEKYCCMEQYMMSEKAKLFDDNEIYNKIMKSTEPNTIKSLGRKVKNFDEDMWNKVKYSIVLNGNYLKFSQNPSLMNFLIQTDDKILVEASPYDGIWGIQMSANDKRAENPFNWNGNNLLGFALTEVREELKRVYQNQNLLDYSCIE